MDIYTVGHSNLSITDFIKELKYHGIEMLVDVRSYPSSRYCPHFNKDNMRKSLNKAGIEYDQILDLGGRRNKRKGFDNRNAGWENASFRNYADYTSTDSYRRGLKELIEIAETKKVAYCCSESVPWKCHRLIISNTLVNMGHKVFHIMGEELKEHSLGLYGAKPKVKNGDIIYPEDGVQLEFNFD